MRLKTYALLASMLLAPLALSAKKISHWTWEKPPTGWTLSGQTLSIDEKGFQVNITYLEPGYREDYFFQKTGKAFDPFGNDLDKVLFKVEIVNNTDRTIIIDPKQFRLKGGKDEDSCWDETQYYQKFHDMDSVDIAKLRTIYITRQVELPGHSKMIRAIVFEGLVFDFKRGMHLIVDALPVGRLPSQQSVSFKMKLVKVKLEN